MKLVKICKKPRIVEDDDRWGVSLGTYSVSNAQIGLVPEQFWSDLKVFENYGNTPEGIAEEEAAKKYIEDTGSADGLEMPLMSKLLKRSKTLLWEFNMQVGEESDDGTTSYIRSYAEFNHPTLEEYTPEHDKRVKRLQDQCDKMNSEQEKGV